MSNEPEQRQREQNENIEIDSEMFAQVCREIYPQQFAHVISECKVLILKKRLDDTTAKMRAMENEDAT